MSRATSAASDWSRELSARIQADRATVFRLLAEAELWPAIFRHIHSVRILRRDGRRRLIAVRATWHGIPIGWTAIQTNEPNAGRMTLHHVSPLTRGSIAVWEVVETPIEARGRPTVELRVRQHVTVPLPLIGPSLASRFVGGWVGRELGQAMLDRVKEIAEGGSLAGRY